MRWSQDEQHRVESLLQLFHEHGLVELKIEEQGFSLHLRRERPTPPAAAPVRPIPPRHRTPSAAPVKPPEQPKKGRTVAVRSPLIGVFYRSPSPDSPAFVQVGDLVTEGQTVCIVEAMKVFNEIKAEWPGRVVAIPPETGALVQTGDPLVVLEFLEAAS